MEHPNYRVERQNGKYVINNNSYFSSSHLLKEVAETMVYLQETFKGAQFHIHLGHQENITLSEHMKDERQRRKDLEKLCEDATAHLRDWTKTPS